jgi:transketolase
MSLHPDSWNLTTSSQLSISAVAGEALAEMAEVDERIVLLTADLKYSNRTVEFERRHPGRFFNLGIAEQNMVSVAAGLAACGFIPYVATFASFVGLLCVEQIRTDLAYPRMRVRILAHHAGISLGFYGTSHHATEDVGIMRTVAGLALVAPADGPSLKVALRQTVGFAGPVYFRLSRGRDPVVYDSALLARWEFGKALCLKGGHDLTIFAYGTTVFPALQAARDAAALGVDVGVFDVHTLKPLDADAIVAAGETRLGVLVVEEHNVINGLATAVADLFATAGRGCTLHRLGIPDEYAPVGPPTALYKHYQLDREGILAKIQNIVANA